MRICTNRYRDRYRFGRRKLRINPRLLLCILFFWLSVCVQPVNIEKSFQQQDIEQTEDFYICSMEIDNYIKRHYPKSKLTGIYILKRCYEYEIDPCFVLAQGIVESGLGTQGSSKTTNNVWNIGHNDGKTTKDMMKSKYHYETPNQSLDPYLKLLKKKYLGKHKTEKHLLNNYVTLGGKRYASNPQYEKQLKYTYNRIVRNTYIKEYFERMLKKRNLN